MGFWQLMGVRRDGLKERAVDKQLQLPSATQPAGISFSFFQILSPCSVKCFCLPDSCMLHVPVELSHTHTYSYSSTLENVSSHLVEYEYQMDSRTPFPPFALAQFFCLELNLDEDIIRHSYNQACYFIACRVNHPASSTNPDSSLNCGLRDVTWT